MQVTYTVFSAKTGLGERGGDSSRSLRLSDGNERLSLIPEESRYRITHQTRTKQRGNGQQQQQQRYQEEWSWEEIMNGKGPWAKVGKDHLPWEQLEATGERNWRDEGQYHVPSSSRWKGVFDCELDGVLG
ncbi:uncharacterized protein ACWYII_012716 [Salvelinus alpinus]